MPIRILRPYRKPAAEPSPPPVLTAREEQALRVRARKAGVSFETIRGHYVRLRDEWPELSAPTLPDLIPARVLEGLGLSVAAIQAHSRQASRLRHLRACGRAGR